MKRNSPLAVLMAAAALVAVSPAPIAEAQSVMRVDVGQGASQSLTLPRGESAVIELPVDARDVLVSNPAVADAVIHNPRRIVLMGIAAGQTDARFFDASGRQILSLSVRVGQSTGALEETLSRLIPDGSIRVEAVNNSLVLTGHVANPGDSERAQRIAAQFVERPEQVLNLLSVTGSDQVMLRVQVIEVQRHAIKQLGFDTGAVLGQVGGPQYLFNSNATFGVNGGLLGGVTGGYRYDTTTQPIAASPDDCQDSVVVDGGNLGNCVGTGRAGSSGLNQANGLIRAFERVGLVRTLAEPNLTTVNGAPAEFLAGGEFPVPVGRDSDGNILTEYKRYGVSLAFTPVVLSGGRISLQISTEVSELTSQGALTIGAGTNTAITLPGLNVRRASNTVELPSGGSMMIAGLLQESTRQNIDSLPGVTNLPVLGSLFRSRDYLSGETELVILVTPYLVGPTSPDRLQTPADGLQIASDAETILLGRLNRAYRPGDPAAAATPPAWAGPVGYVIE